MGKKFQIWVRSGLRGFGDGWTPVKFPLQIAPVKKVLAFKPTHGSATTLTFSRPYGNEMTSKKFKTLKEIGRASPL